MAKEEKVEEQNLEKKKSVAKGRSKVAAAKKTNNSLKKVGASKTMVKEEKSSKEEVASKKKASSEKVEIVKEENAQVKKTPTKKTNVPKQKKAEDLGVVVVAKVNNLKGGVKKLVLIANSISGLKCDVAVSELEFSKKRVAKDVKNVLQSAIANAQNNHNLDLDRLYVKEAIVGKSYTLKRWRARAKGRGVRILKRFSRMEIKLVEK